jgi:hypothetical protein
MVLVYLTEDSLLYGSYGGILAPNYTSANQLHYIGGSPALGNPITSHVLLCEDRWFSRYKWSIALIDTALQDC